MSNHIHIVGAGPGGLLLAKELANAGISVTVYEEKSKEDLCTGHNWSDAMDIGVLRNAGLPIPEPMGNRFVGPGVKSHGATADGLYEPHRITELPFYTSNYSAKTATEADFHNVLTDRRTLAAAQLEQTLAAGATILLEHKAVALRGQLEGEIHKLCVTGLIVQKENETLEIESDLVVDATGGAGVLRQMLKNGAIGRSLADAELWQAYHTVRSCRKTLPGETTPPFRDLYRLIYPNGYSWIHFHDEDVVGIGAAVLLKGSAVSAKEVAAEMADALPQVNKEELRGGGGVAINGMPLDSMVTNGFMVIGNAAFQSNPSNGCGIGAAMEGALLASQVIKGAKRFDIASLWEYNHKWLTGTGAHYAAIAPRGGDMSPQLAELLLGHGFMNGELLTNKCLGNYSHNNIHNSPALKQLWEAVPQFMEQWEKGEAYDEYIFRKYLDYPKTWDADTFAQWCAQP